MQHWLVRGAKGIALVIFTVLSKGNETLLRLLPNPLDRLFVRWLDSSRFGRPVVNRLLTFVWGKERGLTKWLGMESKRRLYVNSVFG